MTDKSYDDIIDLPAPSSERHPRMPREARAAQFAPFSALTGYEEAIHETARLTERETELGEDAADKLDRWQRLLRAISDAEPMIEITYFLHDKRKSGGSYRTVKARLVQFNEYERTITLDGGEVVTISDIKSLDSPIFRDMLDDPLD